MELIRRFIEQARTEDSTVSSLTNVELNVGATRLSDTKSIGSLSQHLFESDEDERYYGTCNGYASQPGSKSNLLLCSECDQKTRTCTYRPQTPGSYFGRYVEERLDPREDLTFLRPEYKTSVRNSPSPRSSRDIQDISMSPKLRNNFQDSPSPRSSRQEFKDQQQQQQQQQLLSPEYIRREETFGEAEKRQQKQKGEKEKEDTDKDEEEEEEENEDEDEDEDEEEDEEDSPVCELCHGNGLVLVHCEHCNFSTEGDLICFRCQSDESSSNGNNGCPRCERSARIAASGVATSDDDNRHRHTGKYPVDAVVKIKLNDHMIDVDSDDTNDSDPSTDRHRTQIERLDTIVEIKGDTASENDDDNNGGGNGGGRTSAAGSAKLNGTTSARFLNYMIVLCL
ncbi:hypothetical protein M0802_013058 [Mischocyttarus mexicanus]|nr:hypothetical protein M0802_013058 [Mischocyttarus mexicanus]